MSVQDGGPAETERLVGTSPLPSPKPPSDLHVESRETYQGRIKSLKVILLTNFLSATGFSLLLPSMWFYFKSMGGTTEKLGLVVGAFSLGQFVGAPFWGWYSTRRSYAETLHLTIALRMLGNLVYGSISVLPLSNDDKFYVLLGSRVLVGFGAGSMAVCNAYIAGATTMQERLKWMGFIAGTGGLGFIFGPLIGSAFGGMPDLNFSWIDLNFMTAPAFFAAVLCIVNSLVIVRSFSQYIVNGPPKAAASPKRGSLSINSRSSTYEEPLLDAKAMGDDGDEDAEQSRDYIAVTAILVIYFLVYCLFAVFETIALPLLEDEYGWSAKHADVISGIISGAFGVQSVVMFLCTQLVAKRIGHRPTLMFGLLIVAVSQLVTIPWAGPPPEGQACTFKWCENGHALPLFQYIFGLVLVYVGFPMANVMLFTIYSKVLGPAPQGSWMGIINSCGSLARTVGPVIISNAYGAGGPLYTYTASVGIVGLALVVTVVVRHRFVAYGTPPGHHTAQQAAVPAPAATQPGKGRSDIYEDDDDAPLLH